MKKLLLVISLVMLAGCNKTEEPKQTSLDAPQNVIVEGTTVTFDSVEGTDISYNLFIEDVTQEKTIYKEINDITTTSVTLPALETNKLYEIRVQAENSASTSVKTNAYTVNTFVALDTLYATYNTEETIPVTILGIDVSTIYYITYGKILNTKLNNDSFTYEQDVLSLSYSTLNTDNTLTFYVFTNEGYHPVEIDKQNDTSPSIYSENIVTFTNSDLYFQFDLAGGELVEIKGNDIDSEDYTLIHNTLIINKEFVSNLFTLNDDRTTVILSYQLKTNDDIIVAYIIINKDTN
jgi:hypothetical protein